jgi:catechol 2,3-dioxygenase-like lactoylglutathione lyase family enzyme
MQSLVHISIIVRDYDEAISWYCNKVGFEVVEDTVLSETKRWVLVSPPGNSGAKLLLAKAANEEQASRIGNQTGGRVFLFLTTNEFDSDYAKMISQKVEIVRQPVRETWGRVAVFKDLYGNLWDLIENFEHT